MLLFIDVVAHPVTLTDPFQYISCYSLSNYIRWVRKSNSVSIHLMLLFIGMGLSKVWMAMSVSIHLMLLFINTSETSTQSANGCFNTSHVTLYQCNCILCRKYVRQFQYISCYSLSPVAAANCWKASWFQYISCYSLSQEVWNGSFW